MGLLTIERYSGKTHIFLLCSLVFSDHCAHLPSPPPLFAIAFISWRKLQVIPYLIVLNTCFYLRNKISPTKRFLLLQHNINHQLIGQVIVHGQVLLSWVLSIWITYSFFTSTRYPTRNLGFQQKILIENLPFLIKIYPCFF